MSEKKRLSVKKNKESQRKAILKFRAETHSTGTDSATESDSGVSKKSKVIVDDKTVNNANISNQQNEVVNINENQIYLPEATPAVNISRQIETETQISILSSADYSDPANWPTHFSDNFRQFVIKNRPQQIEKYRFPRDREEQKRKFSSIYYITKWRRSLSKSSLPALEGSGSNDWKNIGALLSSREKSNSHLVNFQMWKELGIHLSTEKTIDHINQQKINEKEQYWQRILERLIALVRVLATQNLAFRGTNEKLYNNANGNFLKFV
ncbi:zinc finger MYM-type protein 5-like [Hydra vulgaris]|uniref:zinc finger MYM-type protein 5-like n=1 Tax=Hydra vulgaris TaxID=6087 RepID=UPI001F5E4B4C|nr:zinc finger MYM-type protein 5-like [Hydra vulgaris]